MTAAIHAATVRQGGMMAIQHASVLLEEHRAEQLAKARVRVLSRFTLRRAEKIRQRLCEIPDSEFINDPQSVLYRITFEVEHPVLTFIDRHPVLSAIMAACLGIAASMALWTLP
jgi:hypothetical protein